jgi:hypothetical protein
MSKIVVPEPVQCINLINKKPLQEEVSPIQVEDGKVVAAAVMKDEPPWSLYRCLALFVGQRPEWGPLDKALRLREFLIRLDKAKTGEEIEIDDELKRGIKETVKADDFAFPYPYNLQLPVLLKPIID